MPNPFRWPAVVALVAVSLSLPACGGPTETFPATVSGPQATPPEAEGPPGLE